MKQVKSINQIRLAKLIDRDLVEVPTYVEIHSQTDMIIHEIIINIFFLLHRLNTNSFLTDKEILTILTTIATNLDEILNLSDEKMVLNVISDMMSKMEKYKQWALSNEMFEFVGNIEKLMENQI